MWVRFLGKHLSLITNQANKWFISANWLETEFALPLEAETLPAWKVVKHKGREEESVTST